MNIKEDERYESMSEEEIKQSKQYELNRLEEMDGWKKDEIKDEVHRLRKAIRAHRDERGHDACWLDDLELYKVLPEGTSDVDQQLPPEKEFLDNCKRYYDHRKDPNIVFIRQKEVDIERVLLRELDISKFGTIQVRSLEDGTFAVDELDMSGCIGKEEIFKTAREAAVRFMALEKEFDE